VARSFSKPGGEYSYSAQAFTCQGFADALSAATDETLGATQSAIRSALNKVIKSVKSLTSTEIIKKYNVPKAILDDRLTIFAAKVQQLEAELVVGGRSVPLSYFGMRASSGNRRTTVKVVKTDRGPRGRAITSTTRRSSNSISVEVVKGKRTVLKSAFIAVMRSGHIGVMRRGPGVIKARSKSLGAKHRQAIYEHSVVSIATMFNQADVNASVVAKIDADLERTFLHELEFYMGRLS